MKIEDLFEEERYFISLIDPHDWRGNSSQLSAAIENISKKSYSSDKLDKIVKLLKNGDVWEIKAKNVKRDPDQVKGFEYVSSKNLAKPNPAWKEKINHYDPSKPRELERTTLHPGMQTNWYQRELIAYDEKMKSQGK